MGVLTYAMELTDMVKLGTTATLFGLGCLTRLVVRPKICKKHPVMNKALLQFEHYISHFGFALFMDYLLQDSRIDSEMVRDMATTISITGGIFYDGILPKMEEGNIQYDQIASDTAGAMSYFWLV